MYNMNITLSVEQIYFFFILLLLGLQVYQQIQLSKSKKEIDKLWEQISTWNTMVAMKLLEIQDIINKLNENKNKTK
jgi:uncharacterized membrane protein